VIDKHEFRQALGISSRSLAERIFSIFDADNDGGITFKVHATSTSASN
jgi:Ca2+-binding EF-hand superfamily protein